MPRCMRRKIVLRSLLVLGLLLAATWLSGIRLHRFHGRSMQPAVNPGDCFVARMGLWQPREPERFALLIFEVPTTSRWAAAKIPWMKRLVGLPGERVRLSGSTLSINGRAIEAPMLHLDPAARKERTDFEITLGPNQYFVLGDNLDHTTDDSRVMGPIERGLLRGIAGPVVFRAQ